MQSVIVIAIIALAVIYGGWRLYKTMKYGGCGCSPAEGKEQGTGGQDNNCCCGCAGCKLKK